MKKIKFIIYFACLCFLTCNAQNLRTVIYTKGGQAVEVVFRQDPVGYDSKSDDEYYRKTFPNATFLSKSTVTYNCHSYAWNLSDGGGTVCWINATTSSKEPNIEKYWTNDYYSATVEEKAKKIHYCMSDHSAVVSTTVPGMYESKWGAGPLMRHAPNYGPYLNMDKRNYYNHFSSSTPTVKTGLIACSAGSGEIGVNVAAGYYADMGTNTYSTMEYSIETAKGDDAVAEGYAVINSVSKPSACINVTFTRAGIYEMYLRFYNQSHQLVGEFTFEPVVTL